MDGMENERREEMGSGRGGLRCGREVSRFRPQKLPKVKEKKGKFCNVFFSFPLFQHILTSALSCMNNNENLYKVIENNSVKSSDGDGQARAAGPSRSPALALRRRL